MRESRMTDSTLLFSSAGAFLAGVVSFLSPCVLPLVPAYVSYIAGETLAGELRASARRRLHTLALSAWFVLGFSAVFIALGASATTLGRALLRYRYEANLIGGAIVILFGLLTLGLTRHLAWFGRDIRFHPQVVGGRPLAAFGLGIAFGFGWTPCIGPVLGAFLTISATHESMEQGVALLSAYAAGLGLPFLLSALFTDRLLAKLRALRSVGRKLQIFAGGIMVLMGLAMMTGTLTSFAFWLLQTFPVLGRIG